MSTYSELAAKAKEQGAAKAITAKAWKPAKKGDGFVGLLVKADHGHSRQFDSDFSVYKFKTDDALISWIPGGATDAEIGAFLEEGQVYSVVFDGKEKTAQGQDRNRYTVTHIDLGAMDPV